MGTTTETVRFFSDEITLKPHTASRADLIGQPVSLRQFAAGRPITLERITDSNNPDAIGEYIARACELVRGFHGLQYVTADDFMAGPEVTP